MTLPSKDGQQGSGRHSMRNAIGEAWTLLKQSVLAFIEDNALSHAAAIAFYAVTSLAPILLIVTAVAGLAFGNDAAQVALSAQISGLMGSESADVFRTALQSAASKTSGTWATIVGLVTLLVTASGVFGEMQSTLNIIWKAEPQEVSLSRLVRARAASLGLVGALGFLLLVSLVASTVISALGDLINAYLPFGEAILSVINGIVSFLLISAMFGAIYKVLPDRALEWRDVRLGAMVTAALFTLGKSLIGWYLGSSAVASSYGAAGGLLVTLLWVYYSAVIFLLGAEFTRAYSVRHGSRSDLRPLAEAEGKEAMASRAVPEKAHAYPPRKTPFRTMPADMIIASLMAVAWTSVVVTTMVLRNERLRGEVGKLWRNLSSRAEAP
jgi:membrane protein